jgi:hypothetical protein
LPPAPVEPPAWVRSFNLADWSEPDDYELQMTAGLAEHGLTERLAEAQRWHAERRWCAAMNAWYAAHPGADHRFEELLERRRRRLARGRVEAEPGDDGA